jgi:quercetin dioxygenase-like cupin family protein
VHKDAAVRSAFAIRPEGAYRAGGRIEVASQPVTLEAGDAIVFPGDVAHSYTNPRDEPARFSLAVFEPGVGPGSRSEADGA